jgi:hypothetical protein
MQHALSSSRPAPGLAARGPAAPTWLPAGKVAAICFSIDDIHPAASSDSYEAGGDLAGGALGRLLKLQQRHPALKTTLCVTPDWRLDSLVPEDRLVHRIPWVGRHLHWTRVHPQGRFRLDRHPAFVSFLNALDRCEIVPHGLTHAHTGPNFAVEFQDESEEECLGIVQRGLDIFEAANIRYVRGYVPPSWDAPPALIRALGRLDFKFLSSARDLRTPIRADSITSMSGLKGLSLIYPHVIGDHRLVHLACNFQATSSFERASDILDLNGLLHVKAHIFKSAGGRVMLDGFDDVYARRLDRLFSMLEHRFGDQLWWAHLSEVAERVAP